MHLLDLSCSGTTYQLHDINFVLHNITFYMLFCVNNALFPHHFSPHVDLLLYNAAKQVFTY
jgi:hypothetical protein